MYRIDLSDAEVRDARALVAQIAAEHGSVERAAFLCDAATYAQELPPRLRMFLNRFKLCEPSAVCVVAGYPIDEAKIGRTPAHWNNRAAVSATLEEELFFFLCGSLLGDVFGWATQQDGFLVHDVLPIKGHEQEQLGSGSETLLTWHTEDAFHPYKGDYLGLMCLRNPDGVATTFAAVDQLDLDFEQLGVLFEPRFIIRPDESHLEKHRAADSRQPGQVGAVLGRSYERVRRMWTHPQKVPVLFGDPQSPYMCLDPYFMDPLADDPEARTALDRLIQQIDAHLEDLILRPGQCWFIDNYRAVHGRKPFTARYDGYDRWMKRINITRDLRKSRDMRLASDARVIY